MRFLKSNKARAAAIAAAALLLIGAAVVINRPQVFLGIIRDDSGLASVKEGDASIIKKDEERAKVLYVGVTDALGVTNPAYSLNQTDAMISSLIFEPLMRQDAQGVFQKELAKSIDMEADGTACRITLQKNMKFSDGTPLTAEDAAFSLAAMCMNANEDNQSFCLNIEGVQEFKDGETQMPSGIRVEDESHLRVSFANPSPDNSLIAKCRIQKKPEDMADGVAAVLARISTGGIGTGAYVKEEGREGGAIRLSASGCYRKKIRDIKAVEFVLYDSYSAADAVERGDIDIACFGGNSGLFDTYYEGKQFHIYEKSQDYIQYLQVNRDSALLRRPGARRAAALAIDRNSLTGGSLSRYFTGAYALAWENGTMAGEEAISYNPDGAKTLLDQVKEEMGISDANVRLAVLNGNQVQKEIAKAVKKDLEKVGFSVQVNELEQNDYLQQVYMLGAYDLLIAGSGGWQQPTAYSRLVEDSRGLKTASASEELKAAVEKLMTSYDEKSQESALKEANTAVNRMVPVVPLVRQKSFMAVSADLKNYKMNQYDTFIDNVWDIRVSR